MLSNKTILCSDLKTKRAITKSLRKALKKNNLAPPDQAGDAASTADWNTWRLKVAAWAYKLSKKQHAKCAGS